MRLGILGGSFNPPHPGHIRYALGAAEYLKLDKVLMIPAADPPHKQLALGSPEPEKRLEMCRIAAREYPVIEVSDIELNRDGKSYTVDTLRKLRENYPNDELFLIMGMDMFLSFDKWYLPGEICSMATIVMACREGKDSSRMTQADLMEQKICSEFGGSVIRIPLDFIEMSSTTVRRMLVFGCGEYCLDKDVHSFIMKSGAYTTDTERKGMALDELRDDAFSLHDEKRITHVAGCEEAAAKLAQRWGADEENARRAAILHDITKALKLPQQLILAERYGIIHKIDAKRFPTVNHAFTASVVAEYVYGESEDVCSAIRWHTTGKENMSVLEKIIYLADFIEPTRSFDGVDYFRELAYKDLDECLCRSLEHSLNYLADGGKNIHPATRQAYEFAATQCERIGII